MNKILFLLLISLSFSSEAITYKSSVKQPHKIADSLRISSNTSATTYSTVSTACATEATRGTVYYYCDCGTGSSGSCVAGNNSNSGTDPTAPRQTIEAASSFLNTHDGVTVALCKGGAFNVTSGGMNPGSTTCTAGTTCNDLREYSSSVFTSTAKPIINNAAGAVRTFQIDGGAGGLRVLNLKMNGDNGAANNGNRAFYFYTSAHDVTMCNVDMDVFDIAVTNESSGGTTNNIKLTGSHITNSRKLGFLGAGNNEEVSYNFMESNGGADVLFHTIYSATSDPVSNLLIKGNIINAPNGASCLGSIITSHGEFDYYTITDNNITVPAAANSNGGCWGIDLNSGGYQVPVYFRHTTISNNILTNTGNAGIAVEACPGCIIENNVVIANWSGASLGILSGQAPARTSPADDINTANVVRNNTIYYGTDFVNVWGGAKGIQVQVEGTGHIISNNTIYYSSSSSGSGFSCFDYSLSLDSYSFINNNHCYSAATYVWEATHGSTLATWVTYATVYGFDANSLTGDPSFISPGTNFKPNTGSILINAGSNTNKSTTDILGITRPNPPDIGAYQH